MTVSRIDGNPVNPGIHQGLGALEPIRPEYRNRDLRLEKMDEQRIEKAIYFPTLGVGMEEALKHDPEAVCTAFEAFTRWLLDDWGFAYRERIFAAPYLTLMDHYVLASLIAIAGTMVVNVVVDHFAEQPEKTGTANRIDRTAHRTAHQ